MQDSLNDILNRVSDAFIALDKNYCYTYVNDRTCEMVQKSAEELIGRNVWEVFPDAVGSKTYLAITEAMEQQHYVSSVDYYAPLDLWQENNVYPSTDGVTVFIRDITAHKKAEKVLAENESRYRTLIENNFDALFLADENYNLTYQSSSAERITGLSALESVGTQAGELIHPDDVPVMVALTKEMFENHGKPIFAKLRIKHKKGHYLWVEGCATNLLQNENVKSIVFNMHDITAQVEYEQKLIKTQRLYAFISQVNQAIVYTTNKPVLFELICSIGRDFGYFDRTWIGMIDDSGNRLNLMAQSGIPEDELPFFKDIDLSDPGVTGSPLHWVLTEGRHVVVNDVSKGPLVPIWADIIVRRGIKSLGIFPIRKFGKTIGVMSFLISTPDFFDDAEIALLIEAVGDLSFALELFDKEEARKLIEAQLALSESRLSKAQKIAHIGSWVIDLKTWTIVWSDEVYRIMGMNPGDIKPDLRSIVDRTHPEDTHLFNELNARLNDPSAPPSLYFRILKPNGEIRYIHSDREFEFDQAGNPVRIIGIIHDVTEQHEAEKKILNNEKRFRALIENNYDSIMLFDEDMKIKYRSPSSTRIIGWTDAETLEQTRLNGIHPDDIPGVMAAFEESKAKPGMPIAVTYRFKHKDGRYIWLEGRINDLRHDESIKAILLNFRDVNEKHEAEQKLISSEKRFRALIENNYDAILIFNDKFEAIYRSPSTKRISGWDDADINPEERFDYIHADDLPSVRDAIARCTSAPGTPQALVFRFRHKSGNYNYMEGLITDLRHDENIKGYLLNFRDITERQESKQKLISSEKHFRSLIENNYDAITLLDENLVAIYRSPSAQRITGWSDTDLAARSRFDFIHNDDLPQARQSIQFAAADPGKAVEVSFRFLHCNGHYIWVEGMVNDMRHDESIQAFVFNFRDITDRKKAEEALNELNESLEQKVKERTAELTEANLSLDSFSYSVSHDLRSPLGNIMGFIKIIQMEYGDILIEDVKEMLLQMESSARRMNAIIEDLLQLARFSREKMEMEPLDINQIIQKVWANIKGPDGHNAILELMEMPTIHASESMIEQVMINLISNAVKYSSKVDAPVISIGYKNDEKVHTIFVKDNGIGFDMQYYDRLFKPFQRLHISADFEGTGIGLTLVKRIIDKHNGKVWAESTPEQGATFYITLPK